MAERNVNEKVPTPKLNIFKNDNGSENDQSLTIKEKGYIINNI
jgi:hypothetical protein